MRVDVLVAEIGSTTTVVNAFKDLDSDNPVFWAQGQAPTSVMDGDVRIGLQGAIDDLCRKMDIDKLEYDQMLATSSAAGGLKMTVHGLVYDMTAKAAKEAALGAGGIIHDITVGRLRRSDLARIKEINPNLILIAGGVDYGERDTAVYNAEMIRSLGLKTPVVYAGNIENQDEMKLIFDEESGQYLYLVDNVYPKIDTLNVEPCRKVIQDAFEDHITHAPGMEHVREMVNGPIIPTPGAVMECTKLLYDCIGDVMTIDVGGATTDVHAVTEDSDAVARILTAPEPKAKRTVEGDLGVYVNRMKVIESIGEEKLRQECQEDLHIDLDETLKSYVAIPKTEDEFKLVERLTKEATLRAVERHAGQIRYVYGPSGRQTLAEGKDLTQVKYIVGTGGALTRLPHRVEIMKMIPKDNETGMKLYPSEAVKILVDNHPHPGQGVDQGKGVRPGGLRRGGDIPDGGDVRGQLDHQGLIPAPFFHQRRDGLHAAAGRAEIHPALLDVGAGDVEFDQIHRAVPQAFGHFAVFLQAMARDVRDHRRTLSLEPGQVGGQEHLHPGILEPHAVEHTGGGLRDPGGQVPLPFAERRPLARDAAQRRDRIKFVIFHAVAEGTGRGNDGVF